MLISKQQKFMLDVLRRLGCVRKRQLTALLERAFFPEGKTAPPGFVDTLLRQLRYGNIDLRAEEDVIFLPGKRPNARLLEAIDVMLELSDARPLDYWTDEKEPVLLRFSVDGRRVSLFAVLHADSFMGADIRAPPAFGPTVRLVILLSGEIIPPALPVPNTQFYALRQKDGSHRFFSRENT